jgi:hypothetical protein
MGLERPEDLLGVLRHAWSAETGSKWRPQNPTLGQCSVTALVAHDRFGSDMTARQFGSPIADDAAASDRSEAMGDTSRVAIAS